MKSLYEKVGRTAFVTAQWRAEETEQPDPLFSDHVANIFLDNQTLESTANIAKASPSTQLLFRYRTKYFDEKIMAQINNGIKQFLILGSGLDTRPIRLGSDNVRFYEVEQQHVLEFKRQQLEKFGYHSSGRFIPGDYTKIDFLAMLEKEGFDFSMDTFILWEGNVFYLEYEDIVTVLKKLEKKLNTFTITFDYLSKKLIHRSTGFHKSRDLLDSFSNLGAPWKTGFDNIGELAEQAGLIQVNDFLIAEYINNLDSEFRVDISLFDHYSICTLQKKTAVQ